MPYQYHHCTIDALQQVSSKIEKLRLAESSKVRDSLAKAARVSMDLLYNDIVLILKKNFYLDCKIEEK